MGGRVAGGARGTRQLSTSFPKTHATDETAPCARDSGQIVASDGLRDARGRLVASGDLIDAFIAKPVEQQVAVLCELQVRHPATATALFLAVASQAESAVLSWGTRVGHVAGIAALRELLRAASTLAPALSAQDTRFVVVGKDRVEITMIPPKLRIRQPRLSQVGFYSWRLDLNTADRLSIVLASDTLMRTDNIRDIVRGSTLRRCADGKDFSSLRCRTVMTDSVSVRGDELRIVIRDSTIVAMVRKDRPRIMWGSTFEPNGRFRVDRLTVDYDDDDKDRKPPLPENSMISRSRNSSTVASTRRSKSASTESTRY